jgi:hypothetical protein
LNPNPASRRGDAGVDDPPGADRKSRLDEIRRLITGHRNAFSGILYRAAGFRERDRGIDEFTFWP